ncbi:hypothetical protein [Halovivax limisalsi]|uniref:hypothetical protein n=1 Tax=Halovivax limisalsi TaxID=1453760 RepID=UPI001FFD9EC9|nr:hypothetical protein [Halovivax limisalsi]
MTRRPTSTEPNDRTDTERREPESNDSTQMTDDTTTRTEESTANRTGASSRAKPSRPRRPRRLRDVDHTAPVEGPARTFERNNEGRPLKTDGGVPEAETPTQSGDDRPSDGGADVERATEGDREEPATDETDDEETDADPSPRRMSDVDHTSPVDGHVRVFDRGDQDAQ